LIAAAVKATARASSDFFYVNTAKIILTMMDAAFIIGKWRIFFRAGFTIDKPK